MRRRATDPPDAAEQDMLKRFAAEKPVAEEPGQWRLYQWSEGFPIVVGTRNVSGTLRVPLLNGTRSVPDTLLAETPYRVVIWSLAVPAGSRRLVTVYFSGRRRGIEREARYAAVPLPPGVRRLATIRAESGESVTAFAADDDLSGTPGGFTIAGLPSMVGLAAVAWQAVSGGWHARFETAVPNGRGG